MILMATLSSQLISPLYNRLLQSGGDLRATFAGIHRTVAGFGAVLATGMVCVGPTFIGCLYDARYDDAGWYLQLLSVATWFAMLQTTSERVLMARRQTRLMALAYAAKLAVLPPLLFAGFRLGGLSGLILGFAAAEVSRYAFITWALRRQGFSVLLCDGILSLLIVGIAGALLVAGPLVWGSSPKFLRLALETGAFLLLWSLVFLAWRSRRNATEGVPYGSHHA
jgi:O-antigen/teichoic acid export membrane protein